MRIIKKMEDWPDDLHTDFEQVKRMQSAKGLKESIVSLDVDSGVIEIQGSEIEPYKATLKECRCTDFMRRQLPCKHMYALALEMGIIEESDIKRSKTAAKQEIESDLKKYRQLYEDEKLTADSYVKISSVLAKAK